MPLLFGLSSCFAAAVDDSPISSPLVTAMVVELLKNTRRVRNALCALYAVDQSRAAQPHFTTLGLTSWKLQSIVYNLAMSLSRIPRFAFSNVLAWNLRRKFHKTLHKAFSWPLLPFWLLLSFISVIWSLRIKAMLFSYFIAILAIASSASARYVMYLTGYESSIRST